MMVKHIDSIVVPFLLLLLSFATHADQFSVRSIKAINAQEREITMRGIQEGDKSASRKEMALFVDELEHESYLVRLHAFPGADDELKTCLHSGENVARYFTNDVWTRLHWFQSLVEQRFGIRGLTFTFNIYFTAGQARFSHTTSVRVQAPNLDIMLLSKVVPGDCNQTMINLVSNIFMLGPHEMVHAIALYGKPYEVHFPNMISEEANAYLAQTCTALIQGNLLTPKVFGGVPLSPDWAWQHRGLSSKSILAIGKKLAKGHVDFGSRSMRGSVLTGMTLIELLGNSEKIDPERDRPKLDAFCRSVVFDTQLNWLQARPCMTKRYGSQCAWNAVRQHPDP